MRRRTVLAAVGTLGTASLAGCLDLTGTPVTESVSRDYAVSDETVVVVSNRNGPVTVREASGDRLTVSGTKRANSANALDTIAVEVVQGERFVVEVSFESGSGFSTRSVDLTVAVPDGVRVERAGTANGDVTVSGVRGDLTAGTDNGDVDVHDVNGFVRGETSNGSVRVRNTTGLRGAHTSNGEIDAELLAMRDDVACTSANGDVTVRVGEDVAAGIRLTTSNGTASVVDLQYTATTDERATITGRLRGADSPTLRLRSGNGDVTLRPA